MTGAGFSLLEMLLVMVLIAAASVLAAAAITGGFAGMQLRADAKEIAAQLRYTRAQAIATGQPQRFTIDPRAHTWTAPNDRDGEIPEKLGIVFTGAREVQPRERRGRDRVLRRRRLHRRPRAAQREERGVEHRRGVADRRSAGCARGEVEPMKRLPSPARAARLHADRSDRRLRGARAGADPAARHAVRRGAAGALGRRRRPRGAARAVAARPAGVGEPLHPGRTKASSRTAAIAGRSTVEPWRDPSLAPTTRNRRIRPRRSCTRSTWRCNGATAGRATVCSCDRCGWSRRTACAQGAP